MTNVFIDMSLLDIFDTYTEAQKPHDLYISQSSMLLKIAIEQILLQHQSITCRLQNSNDWMRREVCPPSAE